MRIIVPALLALPLLGLGAQAAPPHGKAGLWNITTTTQMPNMPKLPPQVAQMMKQRGIPDMTKPIVVQICMTQEQAKLGPQARLAQAGTKCATRVVSQTATSSISEAVCHGRMEGTVRTEISWRGDVHYDSSSSLKGKMDGRAQDFASRQSGDWVKADCGAVKPLRATPAPGR